MRKRDGHPHAIRWCGRYQPIRAVLSSAVLSSGLLDGPAGRFGLTRHYYKVELDVGRLALLFRDLEMGEWYLERLYGLEVLAFAGEPREDGFRVPTGSLTVGAVRCRASRPLS